MKLRFITVGLVLGTALLILLLTLLTSCQPSQPEPSVVYPSVCGDWVCTANEIGTCYIDCDINIQGQPEPVIQTPEDVLAELRSRQRNYTDEQGFTEPNPVSTEDNKINVESFTTYLPEKGFRVASRYNLLSIGENISKIMGTLNQLQLREILRGGSLRSNTMAFGPRAASYQQFLKLRAGKVVFGLDSEKDFVTTFLLFKEEEPIFDYALELNGGIFKFFEGETIHFLGHDYVIKEVTNTTMELAGVTTPDTIIFRNQRGVFINSKSISEDVLNVTFKQDYLRVIINAPDELKILPGTNLKDYLSNPSILLTNRIDLSYEGLTEVPTYIIRFRKSNEKYKLSFTTNKNMSYTVPLASLDPFKTGDEDVSFIFKEGKNTSDYIIKDNDWFVITNNRKYNGLTNVLKLVSVNENNHLITFQDPALEKFLIYFKGTPGVNATGELIIDKVVHKVYVGKNDDIAVDLDGNGRISRDVAPIVTAGNGIIMINNATDSMINISLITPKEMRENSNSDLKVSIMVNEDGIIIDKNSLKLIQDPETKVLVGMTDYGALFFLEENVNERMQLGDDLIINYPIAPRFADVIVKAYE